MTGEFAIAAHALVFLAHRGGVVSSEGLAENICTNPTRVRKVMARLKRAGLVATKEGAEGGYQLALPPEKITLRAVADGVEAAFVHAGWKSGDPDMDCMIASGMAGALDALYAGLDESCRALLEGYTIAGLEEQLTRSKGWTPCGEG